MIIFDLFLDDVDLERLIEDDMLDSPDKMVYAACDYHDNNTSTHSMDSERASPVYDRVYNRVENSSTLPVDIKTERGIYVNSICLVLCPFYPARCRLHDRPFS